MSSDPLLDDAKPADALAIRAGAPAPVLRLSGRLIEALGASPNLPALSYDDARELAPELDNLLAILTRLRGFAYDVIARDCAQNLRTEVRIGEHVYTFKGGTAYSVDRPEDLHAALSARVAAGDLTRGELDAAIAAVDVPSRIEWKLHNGRLNELAKRGGEVARAIDRHRVVGSTPATLKPKGK